MPKVFNLARMTVTGTPGTGTITLGAATDNHISFADAGVADGDIISVGIEDGTASAVEHVVYTASGTTLSARTNINSTTGSLLSLTSAAEVFIAQDAKAAWSDVDRRNSLLDRIYASKTLGYACRVVNSWATGFKAATDTLRGINAGASSVYDVSNAAASGYVLPDMTSTDALASQTLNADASGWGGYTIRQWINASAIGGSGSNIRLTLAPPSTGANLVVSAMYVGHAAGAGDAYDFDGNQAQITVGGSGGFTLTAGGADVVTDTITFAYDETKHLVVSWAITSGDMRRNAAMSSAFTYYYRAATSEAGTTNATTGYSSITTALIVVKRVEVGMIPGNMTLVTTAQTADASASLARVVLEFDNTATPTLDTDLTVEATCNGGSNWSSAALVSISTNGQAGHKIVETVEQACTAGTSIAARVKTLNGKSIPIYGISLTWR